METIYYIYMIYLKLLSIVPFTGPQYSDPKADLEYIKYIHELNFKLDHYLVLMNFMNYFIRMV